MPKWLNIGFYFAISLLLLDVVAIYGAIRFIHSIRVEWVREIDLLPIAAVCLITVISLYIANAYQFHRRRSAVDIAVRTFFAIVIAGVLISSFLYATKSTDITTVFWRGNLPLALALFALWASLLRYGATTIYSRVVRQPSWVIVGDENGLEQLLGDSRGAMSLGKIDTIEIAEFNQKLESTMDVKGESTINKASGIILASHEGLSDQAIQQLMKIRLTGKTVLGLADFYEQYLLKIPVQQLKDSWFVFSGGFSIIHHDVALKIKRLVDIMLSAVGLIVALPLMIIVAVIVLSTSKGSALYAQARYGQFRKVIKVRKFRTMVDDAESGGAQWSQVNDPRVTTVGKFLRASRLDELPQLWNVLVGDMSFIGPRPERPTFVDKLETEIPYYDLRHSVKPGITGWAQVMYPYGRSVEDALRKLEYDLYYIKNYSLAFDVYILFRTVKTVFSRAGS